MIDAAHDRSRALSGWDENAPWLLSFFDLVLILLCFFIVLTANREEDDRAMMPRPNVEMADAPEPRAGDRVVVPTLAVGTPPPAVAEAVAELESGRIDALPGSLEASFVGLEVPAVNLGVDGQAGNRSTGLAEGLATGAIDGAEETRNFSAGGEYVRQAVTTEMPPTVGSAVPAKLDRDAGAARVWSDLENELREIFRPAGDAVEVEATGQGVTVRLREAIAFPSAAAHLLPKALPLLDEIAAILVAQPDLYVEMTGHTDDVPIATATYPSNWELSAARAAAVARYLVGHARLDPARIRIAGHADNRPIAVGVTPVARARNRRVEVRFVRAHGAPAQS